MYLPWQPHIKMRSLARRNKTNSDKKSSFRYETLDDFTKAIGEYFYGLGKGERKDEFPTVTGLSIFLGLTTQAFNNQMARGEDWAEVVGIAKESVREYATQTALYHIAQIAHQDIRKLYDENGNLKPVHKLDDDIAGAVSSIEVVTSWSKDEEGNSVAEYTKKVKTWDKGAAQERWAKLYGLAAVEKHEMKHTGKIGISSLLDEIDGSTRGLPTSQTDSE